MAYDIVAVAPAISADRARTGLSVRAIRARALVSPSAHLPHEPL